MTLSDRTVTPVAEALLECFRDEISQVAAPPASVCLRTGDRVDLLMAQYRNECCEGLAWVRVANTYPSTVKFPYPDTEPTTCMPDRRATVLELGAVRCAPMANMDTIPSCEEWTAVSRAVQDDEAAMWRALTCWAELAENMDRLWLPGQWSPLTTEGGCVGGILPVTVAINACDF